MSETEAPVRIERDGDVAVVVLDNPPLNLFDVAVFNALENAAAELVALTDPADAGRARAVLFEARGKVVSGGVDVSFFQAIAEGPEPIRGGAGLVRPGRDRRRPDAVDGRAAAAGRASRAGAGEGADLHRRALPGRRPG